MFSNAIEDFIDEYREPLLEMARIGFMTPKLEIYVNTDDGGNIPHFHIRDYATKGNEFHTCIEIKRNWYFHHTGEEDLLNGKLRKRLIDFLSEEDEYGEQNWVLLVKEWNRNNSNIKVNLDTPMPNYMTIIDNRDK